MSAATPSPPALSVVVVTWNNADTIGPCLTPLVSDPTIEIIVVDNDSSDTSLERARASAPDATLIQTGANCGFGAGVNVGAGAATSEVLVLLNPDAIASPETLHSIADRVRAGAAAVSAPRLTDASGIPTRSVRRTPLVRDQFVVALGLQKIFRTLDPDDDLGAGTATGPLAVDVVSGACFATSAAIFRKLGGFDERYFLYGEEVDYCVRTRELGERVEILPTASVMHTGAVSAAKTPTGTDVNLRESRVRWFDSHRGRLAAHVVRLAMVIWTARNTLIDRSSWRSLRAMLRPMRRILSPTHPHAEPVQV